MSGVIHNFGPQLSNNTPIHTIHEIENPRGLYLLSMIHDLTLEAIPRVARLDRGSPIATNWHELMIFTNHHSFLSTQRRLARLTTTASAIEQLQSADPIDAMLSQGLNPVTMPSDGLCLSSPLDSLAFTFPPQPAFSLATLIAFFQPLHLLLQYPLTMYQHPRPELAASGIPTARRKRQPTEDVMVDALRRLNGEGATICAHDAHNKVPPIGFIGSQHHMSFIAFPSVSLGWRPGKNVLPYINIYTRSSQIKEVIRQSNPCVPNATTCHGESHRPVSLGQWEASKAGTWTFYRAGAMVTDVVTRDEWAHGARIEQQVRAGLRHDYAVHKGHPEGFADDINSRVTFVHGSRDDDPDLLVCGACGHMCQVSLD